jgi:sensory rhodopsin
MLETLQQHVSMTFSLVFIAFCATSFFMYLERDRVPEQFRTAIRVGSVYIGIAAMNYFYMKGIYESGVGKESAFPTSFRYIDWVLTTPLMLLKFPLMLGVGEKGRSFMTRLVILDLAMVIFGYVGEIINDNQALHWGFFVAGCVAWVAIAVSLFMALVELPDRLPNAVKRGVRTMGLFVVGGWAIYPLGFFAPLLGLPADVRELIYNVADMVNKVGLCLLVYLTAKRAGSEMAENEAAVAAAAYEEQQAMEGQLQPAYSTSGG